MCGVNNYIVAYGRGACWECIKKAGYYNTPRQGKMMTPGAWDEITCLKGGYRWADLNDGFAPKSTDFSRADPHNGIPSKTTVLQFYETWGDFVDALGLPQAPRKPANRRITQTREVCLEAGLDFVGKYGCIPSKTQWEADYIHPIVSTIQRRFGRWSDFTFELSMLTGVMPSDRAVFASKWPGRRSR